MAAVFFACGMMGTLAGLYFGLSIQNFSYYRKLSKKKKQDDKEAKMLYPDCMENANRKKRSIEYLIRQEEKWKKKEAKQKKKEEKERKRLEKQMAKERKKGETYALPEIPDGEMEENGGYAGGTTGAEPRAEDMPGAGEACGIGDTEPEVIQESRETARAAGNIAGKFPGQAASAVKRIPGSLKGILPKRKRETVSVLSRLDNGGEGYISERCSDCGEDLSEVLSRSMDTQDESYNIIRRRKKEG